MMIHIWSNRIIRQVHIRSIVAMAMAISIQESVYIRLFYLQFAF